jgi:type VI protein secretion system component Hcp
MLMPNLPRLRAPITALCLLAAGFAQAESGAYLKLSGIEGVHRTDPYRGWSEVQGLNFKISREVVPRGGAFDLGKPEISAVGWTQAVDTTMPPLLEQMVRGRPLEETRFQLVADGPGGLATVAQLRLSGAYVTGLSLNGGEFSGALSVDGFGFGHKAFDGKGSLGAQQDTGYDFSEAALRRQAVHAIRWLRLPRQALRTGRHGGRQQHLRAPRPGGRGRCQPRQGLRELERGLGHELVGQRQLRAGWRRRRQRRGPGRGRRAGLAAGARQRRLPGPGRSVRLPGERRTGDGVRAPHPGPDRSPTCSWCSATSSSTSGACRAGPSNKA